MPFAELKLMEMKPVEGTVDCGERGEAGDAVMGGGGHVCRECSVLRCQVSVSLLGAASVLDPDEEEAAGWGGGTGGGAIVGNEDIRNGFGRDAAPAGFDEGSYEVADHVVEEA